MERERFDKSQVVKGMTLQGAEISTTPPEKKPSPDKQSITKGMTLTGGSCPGEVITKRAPIRNGVKVPSVAEFREGLEEARKRVEAVRQRIDEYQRSRHR